MADRPTACSSEISVEPLAQPLVFVDVAAELARFAFDANGRSASGQQHDIEFVNVLVGKQHPDTARTGESGLAVLKCGDAFHQGKPLQPRTGEELTHLGRRLQGQLQHFFGLLVVAASQEGVAVQLATQRLNRLRVFLSHLGEVDVQTGVVFSVGVSHALNQLAKQIVALAKFQRRLVKVAAGVHMAVVKLRLNLQRFQPVFDRGVLRCGVERVRHRARRLWGWAGSCKRRCRCGRGGLGLVVGLQGLDLSHRCGVALDQLADIEGGLKHRAVCLTLGAAHPRSSCGGFADMAALVAAVDGHFCFPEAVLDAPAAGRGDFVLCSFNGCRWGAPPTWGGRLCRPRPPFPDTGRQSGRCNRAQRQKCR